MKKRFFIVIILSIVIISFILIIIIHDYDYWVFSVEPSFVTFPPEDWEGTRIYFGETALIED
ncbi:MAG: hypothetical protein HFJ24_08505 [Clostridia bacterium]|nr:hypothetical protein [Clostridia bacterium]